MDDNVPSTVRFARAEGELKSDRDRLTQRTPQLVRGPLHGRVELGDQDGDVDLIVTNRSGHVRIYRNEAGGDRHWVKVRALSGPRDALGAELTAWVGGRPIRRLCLAASSYASSVEAAVHFGLDDATQVDEFHVRWPDGTEEWFAGCAADQLHVLVMGQGETR